MASNKSFILVHLLSNKECNLFYQSLADKNKERQILLAKALKASKDYQSQKAIIFSETYSSNYEKEKDYLLRNDLRKLNKSILQFLQESIYSSNETLEYYQFLLDRKAYDLFDKEIKKTIERLKKVPNEILFKHQKLWFEFILRYKPRKEANLKKYQKLFLKTIETTPNNQVYYKSYFILLLSILERIIWQYFEIELTDLKVLFSEQDIQSNPQANYNIEKAKSYQVFGQKRIEQLNKCLLLLNKTNTSEIENQNEATYLLSQLGLEYFLQPDFEKSKSFYEKAYINYEILNESQKIQLIYNYASMLCASNSYEAVISILKEHQSIFVKTPYENNISLFSIMAYINTNKTSNLRKQLPNIDEHTNTDAQLYIRILECIVLYYEKDFELSLTKLNNIYNTARYNKSTDKAFIEFSKLFQRFLNAIIIIDKEEMIHKLSSCKQASDDFINAYQLGFGSNMLCSIWLNKEIERLL